MRIVLKTVRGLDAAIGPPDSDGEAVKVEEVEAGEDEAVEGAGAQGPRAASMDEESGEEPDAEEPPVEGELAADGRRDAGAAFCPHPIASPRSIAFPAIGTWVRSSRGN